MAEVKTVDRLFTGWRGIALATFAALQVLVCVLFLPERAQFYGLFGLENSSTRGFYADPVPDRPSWLRVVELTVANSPLQVGDLIKYDNSWEVRVIRQTGDKVGATVERNGKRTHLDIFLVNRRDASSSAEKMAQYTNFMDEVFNLFVIVLGVILVWRGWGQLSAYLLGIGLVSVAIPISPLPSFIDSAGAAATYTVSTGLLNMALIAIFAFPAALYQESGGLIPKVWYGFLVLLLVVEAMTLFAIGWFSLYAAFPPVLGQAAVLEQAFFVVCAICAIYWTLRGYRETGRVDRQRFSVLLTAYAIVILAIAVRFAEPTNTGSFADRLPFYLCNTILFCVFFLLLAYAILRHKVIDVGFALNRTVIYGTVSAILLITFGLAEWAFHHLLPEEWSKASAWVDAGIALSLYLTFHRLRDFVEHHLEKLFFRSWQENEAKLRRFVASASHFENRDALANAYGAELTRFANAPVAIYLQTERGLAHASGGWAETPALFPADDPAFALMRAERQPLDLTETATDLPGVLALPMLDHGTLSGVALLGPKADGGLYRPDEIDNLGWATTQVGLDLAALRARHIEGENRRLAAQVEKLSDLIGTRLSPA